MSRTVFYIFNSAQNSFFFKAGFFRYNVNQRIQQFDVFPFVAAAYIVFFSGGAGAEYAIHRAVMIIDIYPITNVFPVAVYRQFFPFQNIEYHKRDELFGKLIGAVIV